MSRRERSGIDSLALIRQGDRTKLVVTYEGSHLPIALHLHFIAKATVLDTPSVTPPSFNLAAYVRKGALGFRLSKEKQRVVFLIEPKAGEFLRATPIPGDQCITLEPDGRLRVEVHHYDTHQLRNFLWSFGPAIHVLEPPAMRAAFRKGIAALHEAYAKELPNDVRGEAFTPGEIAAVLEAANAGTTSEAEVAEILARNGVLSGSA